MIVATGRSGSIGRFLPDDIEGLKARLEASIEEKQSELLSFATPPSVFIHMAALTSVTACEQDPERAFRLNVEGACRWLKAAAAVGCRRFVQVSTSHVFQATKEPVQLTPDRPGDARSVYGRSKFEAEKSLLELAPQLGVEVVIARIFSVIGKEMRAGFLFPELHRRAHEHDFSPLPGYQNVRDFIEAREACERLLQLARVEALKKPVFHICTGQPKSVRELAVQVFHSYGISETEMMPMFPETNESPNYMISRPTEI